MKKLLLATFGSFAFLLVVNAALFPVFFPDGPPEHYVEGRSSPLVLYSVLAFLDRKSTRLNSSHIQKSRMPSSA